MVASARARQLYPDAFCHPMRPFSAMSWRWRSRCVGTVSAVALGTAVERGGTMTAASGSRPATGRVGKFGVHGPLGMSADFATSIPEVADAPERPCREAEAPVEG